MATAAARRRDLGAYVGMVIALGAFGMCFAGLFFSYAVARAGASSWPPSGEQPLPLGLPALNTLVLALSSLALHRGLLAVRAGRERALAGWLWLTLTGGVAFLALQLFVWHRVWAAGLRPDSGIYGSIFYALTVFHALHVLSGLFALGYLLVRARAGRYTAASHAGVRSVALFWHFVDAVWVVMFVSVYVL
jgi:cytochrome c oxidase subunit 3